MRRAIFAVAAIVLAAALGCTAFAQTAAMGNLGPYPPVNPFLARPLSPNQSVQNMHRYVNGQSNAGPMYREQPRSGFNGYWRGAPNSIMPGEVTRFDNGYFDRQPRTARPPGGYPGLVNNPHYLRSRPGSNGYFQPYPGVRSAGRTPAYGFHGKRGYAGWENGRAATGNTEGIRSFNRNPWFMSRFKNHPDSSGNRAVAAGNKGLPALGSTASTHRWKHHPPAPAPDRSSADDQ